MLSARGRWRACAAADGPARFRGPWLLPLVVGGAVRSPGTGRDGSGRRGVGGVLVGGEQVRGRCGAAVLGCLLRAAWGWDGDAAGVGGAGVAGVGVAGGAGVGVDGGEPPGRVSHGRTGARGAGRRGTGCTPAGSRRRRRRGVSSSRCPARSADLAGGALVSAALSRAGPATTAAAGAVDADLPRGRRSRIRPTSAACSTRRAGAGVAAGTGRRVRPRRARRMRRTGASG